MPRQLQYDEILVLGDLVGYGADPAAVIDTTLALNPKSMIRGNHDKVCAGIEPPVLFNDVARPGRRMDARHAQPRAPRDAGETPAGAADGDADLEICHGAPFDEDFYLFEEADAARAIASTEARICLSATRTCPLLFAKADDPFGNQMGTIESTGSRLRGRR
jgi:hypothetical protein